jgi:hypothetical protein
MDPDCRGLSRQLLEIKDWNTAQLLNASCQPIGMSQFVISVERSRFSELTTDSGCAKYCFVIAPCSMAFRICSSVAADCSMNDRSMGPPSVSKRYAALRL